MQHTARLCPAPCQQTGSTLTPTSHTHPLASPHTHALGRHNSLCRLQRRAAGNVSQSRNLHTPSNTAKDQLGASLKPSWNGVLHAPAHKRNNGLPPASSPLKVTDERHPHAEKADHIPCSRPHTSGAQLPGRGYGGWGATAAAPRHVCAGTNAETKHTSRLTPRQRHTQLLSMKRPALCSTDSDALDVCPPLPSSHVPACPSPLAPNPSGRKHMHTHTHELHPLPCTRA